MNAYAFELTARSGTIYEVPKVIADNLAGALKIAERHAACGPANKVKVQSAALGDTYWHPLCEARKLERIAGTARP